MLSSPWKPWCHICDLNVTLELQLDWQRDCLLFSGSGSIYVKVGKQNFSKKWNKSNSGSSWMHVRFWCPLLNANRQVFTKCRQEIFSVFDPPPPTMASGARYGHRDPAHPDRLPHFGKVTIWFRLYGIGQHWPGTVSKIPFYLFIWKKKKKKSSHSLPLGVEPLL